MDDDELLVRSEAAKVLRLSVRGLDRISEAELERVTVGRRRLIRRRAIREYINRHARGGNERQEPAV